MRRSMLLSAGLFVTLAAAADARAQFGGGGAASFDPEIGIVESGAKLDVQATVSADRKYVTMTMRPQLSTLIALREFTFQQGSGTVGFNGGGGGQPQQQQPPVANNGVPQANPAPRANAPAAAGNAPRNRGPLMPALARPAEPKEPNRPTPVLHREGMTRVDVTPAAEPPATRPATPAMRRPNER